MFNSKYLQNKTFVVPSLQVPSSISSSFLSHPSIGIRHDGNMSGRLPTPPSESESEHSGSSSSASASAAALTAVAAVVGPLGERMLRHRLWPVAAELGRHSLTSPAEVWDAMLMEVAEEQVAGAVRAQQIYQRCDSSQPISVPLEPHQRLRHYSGN